MSSQYKYVFPNDKWKNIIKKGCEHFKVHLNNEQINSFTKHAEHLFLWNKTINLTSIKDPEEAALKHFVDSIALSSFVKKGGNLIDIGSGGGFPGFCLKVVNPDLNVVMIDSSKKKVNFLKDLIRNMGFKHINAVHIRAEDMAELDLYRHKFDFAVSRAFAGLDKFFNLARPFLNEKGIIYAMKGQIPEDEINKLKDTTEFIDSEMDIVSYSYVLPFEQINRSIIKIY